MGKIDQVFFLGLLVLALGGCNNKKTISQPTENENYCLSESFKEKLEFETAVREQVVEFIPLTGSVETNPDKVIPFVSLVGGVISNTHFSLGDHVTKDQVLAELHSTELSSLQSQLQRIGSQIRVAENRMSAVQSMYDDGISSEKELTEAESDLEVLKAEKQKINANLNLYSASAEKNVFQIKAPASGIITAKSIASGTQISADGEPLFTVSDLREVWVLANVYASNVQNIKAGMEVTITTLSYPDEIFEGEIATISQVYDLEARVLKARVVLPNKDLKLKPGMVVDVTAMKKSDVEALQIPTSAVVFDDNQNFVVVYKDDCEVEIRKVEILSKSNGITYLSAGINEHEKILSKNQLLVYEQIKNF